ncbi:MAG: MFS transporter [Fimbriimonas sp.]
MKVRNSFPHHSQTVAFGAASLASLAVLAAIYFGSGRLTRFDTPLAAYAAATIFAAFGMTYRYLMWVQRPSTWKYFVASLRLILRPKTFIRSAVHVGRLAVQNIVAQKFILNRGRGRWVAHMCMAWGCLMAFAITFPLSWGWVAFGHDPTGQYVVEFMGMRQFTFPPHSIIGWAFFNGLNISAVFVIVGVGVAMHRRLFDRGAQAVHSLENDLIPLFLLFAVSVTGLMLTASYKLMGGEHFSFLSLLHAFTVIVLLMWMPFGKLFHVVQRPAQIGVQFYKEEGATGEKAFCLRSGHPYQSKLHHDDLVDVMKEVGFDFGDHQNLSPQEKRKLIALNQAALLGEVPYAG